MEKSGALDLATGLGGKLKKEEVESAVEKYIILCPFYDFFFCYMHLTKLWIKGWIQFQIHHTV